MTGITLMHSDPNSEDLAGTSSRRSSPPFTPDASADLVYPPVGQAFADQARTPGSTKPSSPKPSLPKSSSPKLSSPPHFEAGSRLPSSPPRFAPRPHFESNPILEKLLILTCLASLTTNLITLLVVIGAVVLAILALANS